jgi:hypothetical protein
MEGMSVFSLVRDKVLSESMPVSHQERCTTVSAFIPVTAPAAVVFQKTHFPVSASDRASPGPGRTPKQYFIPAKFPWGFPLFKLVLLGCPVILSLRNLLIGCGEVSANAEHGILAGKPEITGKWSKGMEPATAV